MLLTLQFARAVLVLKECMRLDPKNATVSLQAAQICLHNLREVSHWYLLTPMYTLRPCMSKVSQSRPDSRLESPAANNSSGLAGWVHRLTNKTWANLANRLCPSPDAYCPIYTGGLYCNFMYKHVHPVLFFAVVDHISELKISYFLNNIYGKIFPIQSYGHRFEQTCCKSDKNLLLWVFMRRLRSRRRRLMPASSTRSRCLTWRRRTWEGRRTSRVASATACWPSRRAYRASGRTITGRLSTSSSSQYQQ